MMEVVDRKTKKGNEKILFLYRGGREERFADAVGGRCPTEFYYGAAELLKQGRDITIEDVNYQTSSVELGRADKILDLLFRYDFLPSRVYGPLLRKVWKSVPRFRQMDAIVATTPGIAFAVAILKTLYRFPARIIGIQLGLTQHEFSKRRRFLNSYCLKRINNIVYIEQEIARMVNYYKIPESSLNLMQFGIDADYWSTEGYNHRGHVFALGSDGNRDYELLFKAAEKIDRKFVVVTKREFSSTIPGNVKLIRSNWIENSLTDDDIRKLYADASVVVVPLKHNTQPSGQSVSLQAMSCRRPVILSDTQGLWSGTVLRNDDTVVMTEPENEKQLTEKLRVLLADEKRCQCLGEAARKAVLKYATIEGWSQNLMRVIER